VLAIALVDLELLKQALRQRLDAMGRALRAELLHVLMLPDFKRHNLLADKPRKKTKGDRGDAAPEEQGQRAMRVVVALILAVLPVLIIVSLATRGYDDEERPSGRGWRTLEALIHLVSWSH
jgi:hypothetical protein